MNSNSKIRYTDALGIGQGTVLGPLCFAIYLSELAHNTRLLTLMFADDTSFMAQANDINELTRVINNELKIIEDWFLANGLHIHPKKTRFMVEGKCETSPELMLAGQSITRVGEQFEEKS